MTATIGDQFCHRTNTVPNTGLSRLGIREDTLASFRRQLSARAYPSSTSEKTAHLRELASCEAEALAWTTPYPMLLLPVLLDEKVEWVNRYEAHQAAVCRLQR